MPLKEYKAKRNFSKTDEPAGNDTSAAAARQLDGKFVVQKHAARRLHYDFRLAMEGVLKSWAVPKGFPLKKGERRLAMHVEDHPIEYAGFEGIIPEGNYGAGTVMVWDQGDYSVIDDSPLDALRKGKLRLRLKGQKLDGVWTLVRMKRSEQGNEWLLLKSESDAPPISARRDDESVLTQRSLEQIATAGDAEWQSNRAVPAPRFTLDKPDPVAAFRERLDRLPARKPNFVKPMLCALVKQVPKQGDWQYEIKFDGYRVQAIQDGNKVQLISRNGKNLTSKYQPVADALRDLTKEAVLDGELVVLDETGKPSFQLLQEYEKSPRLPLVFYAFDLLQLNGRDLTGLPLEERKEILAALLSKSEDPIRLSPAFQVDPDRLIKEFQVRGLEGLIAKRRHSKYESGKRSGAWAKFKWAHEQEFVIGGYTKPEGTRQFFGALLVGVYESGKLIFVSKVGTGFTDATLRELHDQFQKLRRADPPFVNVPEKRVGRFGQGLTATEMKRCTWVEPRLVCQVRFTEWTRDHHLRHPVFLGLRNDKEPQEVVKEE